MVLISFQLLIDAEGYTESSSLFNCADIRFERITFTSLAGKNVFIRAYACGASRLVVELVGDLSRTCWSLQKLALF